MLQFQIYPYKKGLLTQLVLGALFTAVIYFYFFFCSRHISHDGIDVYEIAFAIAQTTDNFNLLFFEGKKGIRRKRCNREMLDGDSRKSVDSL